MSFEFWIQVFFSPVYAFIASLLIFLFVKFNYKEKSVDIVSFLKLVGHWAGITGAVLFGIGIVISYAFFPGGAQTPLFAIFVIGPIGVSLGCIVGTVLWLIKLKKGKQPA